MNQDLVFGGQKISMGRVYGPEDFFSFLDQFNIADPFIVKPNWINEETAHLTDPVVLGWLLQKLSEKGETYVVEAYSARNQAIKFKKRRVEDKLERYRRAEKIFLRRQGLDKIFEEFGVTYVNVDEEVLAGNTADPEKIRSITESKFGGVEREELYSYVPATLYDVREGTMISFAKFKLTFSMCTKNIFGLIPDLVQKEGRGFYHGKKDRSLPRSIIDINKIYRATFNVVGMVEGVRTLTGFIDRGQYHSMFGYDYEVYKGLGLVCFGSDPLWLDAFIAYQSGIDPRSYRTSTIPEPHLALGYEEISPWPKELEEAAKALGNPLTYEGVREKTSPR